jgi:hypothetical protein
MGNPGFQKTKYSQSKSSALSFEVLEYLPDKYNGNQKTSPMNLIKYRMTSCFVILIKYKQYLYIKIICFDL